MVTLRFTSVLDYSKVAAGMPGRMLSSSTEGATLPGTTRVTP